MRILIGSVTNAPPEILKAHLTTVKNLQLPANTEVNYLYLADPGISAESQVVLEDFLDEKWLWADSKPEDARHVVTDQTHEWSVPTFHWLGAQKDRILKAAQRSHHDAVFLVDSDLLLGPDTLASLVAAQKPVTSAVFWTRWTPDQPSLPQVWLQHPYGFTGKGMAQHEFLSRLQHRGLVPCRGLGACTLIRSVVLPKVSFAPVAGLPSGGMWQGEDRHFCVRAERNYVPLWADAWPDIFHVYRPEDVQKIPEMLQKVGTSAEMPTFGALVSFSLEACEEPALADHIEAVRGRLGQLRLLPEIEEALLQMKAGDERFLEVRFPEWYPIKQYRNQDRVLRLRLLGAKPYAPPVHG